MPQIRMWLDVHIAGKEEERRKHRKLPTYLHPQAVLPQMRMLAVAMRRIDSLPYTASCTAMGAGRGGCFVHGIG